MSNATPVEPQALDELQPDPQVSEPSASSAPDSAEQNGASSTAHSLELVMDIPVTLSMELGRTRMSIRDLLQLAQGSVVKLDRPAGEPLDVLVNGCLIARGEVVVVNDRFGVRITDIVSPEERVKRLR